MESCWLAGGSVDFAHLGVGLSGCGRLNYPVKSTTSVSAFLFMPAADCRHKGLLVEVSGPTVILS